ncbi:hypothetical protein GOZ81_03955 [Agrobacterium vitis]|uniref:hypothetical protein n=1 Tax=Agrobacterium vitis TaxID=373 RepID=UPI0012E99164|nr:hypothetical protein [Agrobacterium vitis]MVA70219.1 hypothetical protein [Agrobacterium vitis]
MASKETLKIAFKTGGILPASVMSAEKDERVAARVPRDVPADYAQQLIGDKFAYLYEDDDEEDDAAAWAKAEQDAADKKAAEEAAAKAKAEEEAAAKAQAEQDAAAKAKAEQAAADKKAADEVKQIDLSGQSKA